MNTVGRLQLLETAITDTPLTTEPGALDGQFYSCAGEYSPCKMSTSDLEAWSTRTGQRIRCMALRLDAGFQSCRVSELVHERSQPTKGDQPIVRTRVRTCADQRKQADVSEMDY